MLPQEMRERKILDTRVASCCHGIFVRDRSVIPNQSGLVLPRGCERRKHDCVTVTLCDVQMLMNRGQEMRRELL